MFVRMKNWQAFLLLTTIPLLMLVLSGFDIDVESYSVLRVIDSIGSVIWLSWPLIWGLSLNRYLSRRFHVNRIVFSLALIVIGAYAVFQMLLPILPITLNDSDMSYVLMIAALPVQLFALYGSFSLASQITQAEKDDTKDKGNWFLTLLQILAFPLGIWLLQPRVNSLYNQGK